MSNVPEQSWEDFNRAYLMEAVEDVREALRKHRALAAIEGGVAKVDEDASAAEFTMAKDGDVSPQAPPALETLCAIFGLSSV